MGESVVSIVAPDSSEVYSEPLPDPEPPVVSLLSGLKPPTTPDKELDVAEPLKKYEESLHPQEETLPDDQRGFRVKVLTTFLKAGVKLESF